MNFATHISDQQAHLRALAAVPGCHPYVLDKARDMEKRSPMYAGFAAIAEDAIGAEALPAARKALEWFAKFPAQEGACLA